MTEITETKGSQKLRKAVEALGGQVKAAAKSGLSQATISLLLTLQVLPSRRTQRKLEVALSIDPSCWEQPAEVAAEKGGD